MRPQKHIYLLLILTSTLLAGTGTYSGGNGTALSRYEINDLNDLAELVQTSADWDLIFQQTSHFSYNRNNPSSL